MGMSDRIWEVLGKTAYEKHVGLTEEQKDRYFKLDVSSWLELPTSSRNHWKNIARAVISKHSNLDVGDLY